jgi:hypothetical protein
LDRFKFHFMITDTDGDNPIPENRDEVFTVISDYS